MEDAEWGEPEVETEHEQPNPWCYTTAEDRITAYPRKRRPSLKRARRMVEHCWSEEVDP